MVRFVGDGESDILVLVGDVEDFLTPKLRGDPVVVTEVNVEEGDAKILGEGKGRGRRGGGEGEGKGGGKGEGVEGVEGGEGERGVS